jgi:hypothetical protein
MDQWIKTCVVQDPAGQSICTIHTGWMDRSIGARLAWCAHRRPAQSEVIAHEFSLKVRSLDFLAYKFELSLYITTHICRIQIYQLALGCMVPLWMDGWIELRLASCTDRWTTQSKKLLWHKLLCCEVSVLWHIKLNCPYIFCFVKYIM